MSSMTIYRKDCKKLRQFYQNNIFIGTSRNTHGFLMDEITVYQDGIEKIKLKEVNYFVWFLRHIPIFSIFFMLLINSRFVFLEDGKNIGYTADKWFRPVRNFIIHGNTYQLYAHKNNFFSLLKNGVQVSLYKKLPYSKCKRNTYYISFLPQESLEIIQLFCIFIDLFFYDNYNGRIIEKNVVFSDHHSEHLFWSPEQSSFYPKSRKLIFSMSKMNTVMLPFTQALPKQNIKGEHITWNVLPVFRWTITLWSPASTSPAGTAMW